MGFRNEYKHQVTEFDIIGLRERLQAVASRDKHAGSSGIYTIKSLYFDNYFDKALVEKMSGIDKREKFRIRYYNDDVSFIRLEKKSKINGYCLKQSAPVSYEQVVKLLEGDTLWMKYSQYELVNELRAKMQFQLMRPRSIVAYEREPFVYAPGNVRVTIDFNIRGSENVSGFFRPDEPMIKLYNQSVLEVKWDAFLPQIIRDAVQLGNVSTTNFSKYAATRFSAV